MLRIVRLIFFVFSFSFAAMAEASSFYMFVADGNLFSISNSLIGDQPNEFAGLSARLVDVVDTAGAQLSYSYGALTGITGGTSYTYLLTSKSTYFLGSGTGTLVAAGWSHSACIGDCESYEFSANGVNFGVKSSTALLDHVPANFPVNLNRVGGCTVGEDTDFWNVCSPPVLTIQMSSDAGQILATMEPAGFYIGPETAAYLPVSANIPGLQVPQVPEPACWTMMLAGFGVIGAAIRRRKVTVSFT